MTVDEYGHLPRAERLTRLALSADRLAAALRGRSDATLSRRPAAASWAPVEVICHLRDTEESFLDRMRQIVLMDEPRFARTNPNRWAEERQYRLNDAGESLGAFTRRREETLAFLRGLAHEAWTRGGVHLDSRGRRTLDDLLSVMAWHDDNHLDQLTRALEGRA